MNDGLPFVALLTGALSLAAWIFWTWMLWAIMTKAQEQSETLQSILWELRKAKPQMSEGQGTAIGRHAMPSVQRRPSEADETKDRMALEAMGFSDETTKPKPKGQR